MPTGTMLKSSNDFSFGVDLQLHQCLNIPEMQAICPKWATTAMMVTNGTQMAQVGNNGHDGNWDWCCNRYNT
jgi:hypothetical protein